MTQEKQTKHHAPLPAVICSVIALGVCITLFLQTTFAYFTDTASVGVSGITGGGLATEMSVLAEGGTWQTVTDAKTLFQAGGWSVGDVRIVYLKLKNLGTLPINYIYNVKKADAQTPPSQLALADVLRFKTIKLTSEPTVNTLDAAAALASPAESTALGTLPTIDTAESISVAGVGYAAVVVYWPTESGAGYDPALEPPTITLDVCVRGVPVNTP